MYMYVCGGQALGMLRAGLEMSRFMLNMRGRGEAESGKEFMQGHASNVVMRAHCPCMNCGNDFIMA